MAIIADKAMDFSGFDIQTSVIFYDFFLLVFLEQHHYVTCFMWLDWQTVFSAT